MRALRAAIHERQFSPAYYLHGEDEYIKEEAVRQLIDVAVDPATRDFNLDQRKGEGLDAASLESLLATPPMMAERRLVVIRDVTGLRKDARAVLDKYLRAPAADTMVVLTAPADAKIDATLAKLAVEEECKPLTGTQLPKWIAARAEKMFGATISPEAVELLQGAVGTDLSQLALELEKLASYSAGRPIDEDAVAAVVGVRRDETPGRLLDAVAMRDTARAMALIPGVLQQPKAGAVPMVMALTTQTLALATVTARKIPPARQYNEYMTLLKSGSSNLTLRAWGEACSSWSRAHGKWTTADLDHALDVLLQTDLALKSSRVSSDEQILATAILRMCSGASYRNAA